MAVARKVVQFATSDNVLHSSVRVANRHQAKIDASAEVLKCLTVSLSTMRSSAIVGQILDSADTLLPILLAYKKKTKLPIDKAS